MITATIKARVFAIENIREGYDLSEAKKYGNLVVLLKTRNNKPSVFNVDAFQTAVLDQLRENDFNHETDYILMLGSLLPISIAVNRIVCEYGTVKILMFCAHDNSYIERVLRKE